LGAQRKGEEKENKRERVRRPKKGTSYDKGKIDSPSEGGGGGAKN